MNLTEAEMTSNYPISSNFQNVLNHPGRRQTSDFKYINLKFVPTTYTGY